MIVCPFCGKEHQPSKSVWICDDCLIPRRRPFVPWYDEGKTFVHRVDDGRDRETLARVEAQREADYLYRD